MEYLRMSSYLKVVIATTLLFAIAGCGKFTGDVLSSGDRERASAIYGSPTEDSSLLLVRQFAAGDWIFLPDSPGADAYRLSVSNDGSILRFYMATAPGLNWGEGITDELLPYKDAWADSDRPMYGFKTKDGAIRFIVGPDGTLAYYEFEHKKLYRLERTSDAPLRIEYAGGNRLAVGILARGLKVKPEAIAKVDYISPSYGEAGLFPSRRLVIHSIVREMKPRDMSEHPKKALVVLDQCMSSSIVYDGLQTVICRPSGDEEILVATSEENIKALRSAGPDGAIVGGQFFDVLDGRALLLVP